MKCPTCGKKHYSSVTHCLNCGYPMVQFQTERDIRKNPELLQQPYQQTYIPPTYPQYYPTIPPANPYQNVYTYYPQQQYIQQPLYARPLVQQPSEQQLDELSVENEQPIYDNKVAANESEGAIEKPTFGYCVLCNSDQLIFYDNGKGVCISCGRTFNWLDIELQRKSDENKTISDEDNPFIVNPDEVLPISERKAEVASEDEYMTEMIPSVVESKTEEKTIEIDDQTLLTINEGADNETRLMLLEIKYSKGEVSEDVYSYLRKILVEQLVQELEDNFLAGKLNEDEFKTELKKLRNERI